MKRFIREFMIAARQTPRMYFAIFVGAAKGIRAELAAVELRNELDAKNAKAQQQLG
jgi:predicted xylose isomerase-like sugar epimerase